MGVTKKRITITIDCDLYNSAKVKYNNISGRVNELLAMDLYGSQEKEDIIEELQNLKIKEKSLTKRLCELEKEEVMIEKSKLNNDKVIGWINETYERNGVIGLNKLKNECERNHVVFEEMVDLLELEGIAYVKFA